MTTGSTLLVLLVTFLVSCFTLLTGFGVGSVLTPTFTVFHDVKTAVFLVSIVHLGNNVLKLGLFFRHVEKNILLRFGLVSVLGALAGSFLQGSISQVWVVFALAAYLILAGILEFIPRTAAFQIPKKLDHLGGFFSGLMGGLIGNQGAIRSAYLLNYDLSKEAFIGTATCIAIVIDLTRIPVYIYQQAQQFTSAYDTLLMMTAVAFAGTLAGRELLKRISLERFRKVVAVFLVIFGVFLLVRPS